MDIWVPTVSQILVYFIQIALAGCIHEFSSIVRLDLRTETHTRRHSGTVDRQIIYVYVEHRKTRFLKAVAHRRSFLDLPFTLLCDILSTVQIQS